jgi:hypothetical protein
MTMVAKNVAELLTKHVTLEVECIDRMYMNGYVPGVQFPGGFIRFVREQLGMAIPSTAAVSGMRNAFIKEIASFVEREGVEVVEFGRKERKDDIAQERLAKFEGREGVLFVGKAQEKASVFRTAKRKSQSSGKTYPWIYRGTAMPNHYYFYLVDEDFGLMFIKICSYFPYSIRFCINGHEWVKRQLEKEGIGFEPLDNGILTCDDPQRLQQLCDELDEEKIDAVFRKWLARLPHPWSPQHRNAGYRYQLSILQAEFALTQVFDRPLAGRQLFEEIIRDHLDLGRPSQVQLIFGRRITKRTRGTFRTRIITEGVLPSLNVLYKWSRIKQYFKLGRALRTETVINNTRDFNIGRMLCNLPALRQLGFQANRRLLRVQTLSHDCMVGEEVFRSVTNPVERDGQRGSALRYGDPRVMSLMSALCLFFNLPEGFRNSDLRANVAQLLGEDPATYKPGRMTYDLRRLRLHGLIRRIRGSHRYHLTEIGIRTAAFYTKTYARLLRPALSLQPSDGRSHTGPDRSSRGLRALQNAVDLISREACLAPQT